MGTRTVAEFVAELKSITARNTDPAAVIERIIPLAQDLAQDTSWVQPAFYQCDEEQGFGITVLNQEPDDGLFVEVICWLPGRGVAPHDHQTWGVVVGLDGEEINVDWRRLDDGSQPGYAELETAKETTVTQGAVVSFLPNDIHSVRNDGDVPSLSLHVYGNTLSAMKRSEFDPINKTQKPCPQRKRPTIAAE